MKYFTSILVIIVHVMYLVLCYEHGLKADSFSQVSKYKLESEVTVAEALLKSLSREREGEITLMNEKDRLFQLSEEGSRDKQKENDGKKQMIFLQKNSNIVPRRTSSFNPVKNNMKRIEKLAMIELENSNQELSKVKNLKVNSQDISVDKGESERNKWEDRILDKLIERLKKKAEAELSEKKEKKSPLKVQALHRVQREQHERIHRKHEKVLNKKIYEETGKKIKIDVESLNKGELKMLKELLDLFSAYKLDEFKRTLKSNEGLTSVKAGEKGFRNSDILTQNSDLHHLPSFDRKADTSFNMMKKREVVMEDPIIVKRGVTYKSSLKTQGNFNNHNVDSDVAKITYTENTHANNKHYSQKNPFSNYRSVTLKDTFSDSAPAQSNNVTYTSIKSPKPKLNFLQSFSRSKKEKKSMNPIKIEEVTSKSPKTELEEYLNQDLFYLNNHTKRSAKLIENPPTYITSTVVGASKKTTQNLKAKHLNLRYNMKPIDPTNFVNYSPSDNDINSIMEEYFKRSLPL